MWKPTKKTTSDVSDRPCVTPLQDFKKGGRDRELNFERKMQKQNTKVKLMLGLFEEQNAPQKCKLGQNSCLIVPSISAKKCSNAAQDSRLKLWHQYGE